MSKGEAKRKLEEAARKLDKVYMRYRGNTGVWDSKIIKLAQEIRKAKDQIK